MHFEFFHPNNGTRAVVPVATTNEMETYLREGLQINLGIRQRVLVTIQPMESGTYQHKCQTLLIHEMAQRFAFFPAWNSHMLGCHFNINFALLRQGFHGLHASLYMRDYLLLQSKVRIQAPNNDNNELRFTVLGHLQKGKCCHKVQTIFNRVYILRWRRKGMQVLLTYQLNHQILFSWGSYSTFPLVRSLFFKLILQIYVNAKFSSLCVSVERQRERERDYESGRSALTKSGRRKSTSPCRFFH